MTIEQPLKLSDDTLIYVEVDAEDLIRRPAPAGDGGGLEQVSRSRDMLESGAKMVGEVAEVSFAKVVGIVKTLASDLSGALQAAAAVS